jgi:hypothetical protein
MDKENTDKDKYTSEPEIQGESRNQDTEFDDDTGESQHHLSMTNLKPPVKM